MSSTDVITPTTTRQALAIEGRSGRLKVTGKLKTAIDSMVWQGLARANAAEAAGLKPYSLYSAFLKPHVKAYYLAQLDVLRTSEKARSIHRLSQIRDKADNMPAVQAARYFLEDAQDNPARSAGSVSLPGLVINIINAPAERPAIDVSHTDLTHD